MVKKTVRVDWRFFGGFRRTPFDIRKLIVSLLLWTPIYAFTGYFLLPEWVESLEQIRPIAAVVGVFVACILSIFEGHFDAPFFPSVIVPGMLLCLYAITMFFLAPSG